MAGAVPPMLSDGFRHHVPWRARMMMMRCGVRCDDQFTLVRDETIRRELVPHVSRVDNTGQRGGAHKQINHISVVVPGKAHQRWPVAVVRAPVQSGRFYNLSLQN